MAFKFNALTGELDIVGASTGSSSFEFFNRYISSAITVPTDRVCVTTDLVIQAAGTFTLEGDADLVLL
jgi:hypothetical protein